MLEEPPRPLKAFGADGYKIRVNAMWFGSLILSLIAALFSIHCKQWLDGYGVRLFLPEYMCCILADYFQQADFIFAGSASGSHEGLINACRLRQYVSTVPLAYSHISSPMFHPHIISALPGHAKISYPRTHRHVAHPSLFSLVVLRRRTYRLSMAFKPRNSDIHLSPLWYRTLIPHWYDCITLVHNSISVQDTPV